MGFGVTIEVCKDLKNNKIMSLAGKWMNRVCEHHVKRSKILLSRNTHAHIQRETYLGKK